VEGFRSRRLPGQVRVSVPHQTAAVQHEASSGTLEWKHREKLPDNINSSSEHGVTAAVRNISRVRMSPDELQ
jgi:hypothetical protein